jgi:signal peptidase I
MCGASGTFVKRLIGLPGDTVTERDGGFVYINGKRLNETYLKPGPACPRLHHRHLARAQGELLLHGRQPGRVV